MANTSGVAVASYRIGLNGLAGEDIVRASDTVPSNGNVLLALDLVMLPGDEFWAEASDADRLTLTVSGFILQGTPS